MRINKNKAYILGVLFGDGCVPRKKGKPVGLILNVKDKDFAEYFCKISKKEGLNPIIRKKILENKITKKYNLINYLMYRAEIYNTQFAKECFKLMNRRRNIPKEILNSRKGCKKMFIKGVMDSEGWISMNKRKDLKRGYSYSMGIGVKSNFIYDLKKLFDEVNIRVNKVLLNKITKILYFNIRLWDYYDSKIGFSIKRKQERLEDFGRNFKRKVGTPKGISAHNRRFDITKKLIKKLRKMMTVKEIAKKYKCSQVTIYKRLKE